MDFSLNIDVVSNRVLLLTCTVEGVGFEARLRNNNGKILDYMSDIDGYNEAISEDETFTLKVMELMRGLLKHTESRESMQSFLRIGIYQTPEGVLNLTGTVDSKYRLQLVMNNKSLVIAQQGFGELMGNKPELAKELIKIMKELSKFLK